MPYAIQTLRLDELDGLNPDNALSAEEKERYASFKIEKRRREWLGGRMALKQAVQKHHNTLFGHLPQALITARPDEKGKPRLYIDGQLSAIPVSISHSSEYAAAAVGLKEGMALGMDLEKIEERPVSWVKEVFHPAELTSLEPEFLTAIWTKKEAALKALGIGLNASFWDVRFRSDSAEFYGSALPAWHGIGSKTILTATYGKPKGYIMSIAFELDSQGADDGRFN
ncbi:MAG: 4'-phosphopantetheinyl transferase superfamily protein [Elusimicrobia bacterium]|nr:4'-phosphopantetheinyl transferase superfamily protein [Elusimicrobiota bacterium]